MKQRGASPEFQQDRADVAERREIIRRDRDLERMIRGADAGLVPGSRAYRDELVCIVRRHTAELVAALARKEILIDHLERAHVHPECHPAALCDGPGQAREIERLQKAHEEQEAVILSGTAALQALTARTEEQAGEIDRLRSEAGYYDAADVIAHLTAQRDSIERATWAAAAKMADDMRTIPSGTSTSTRELWRNEMAGDLTMLFSARAAAQGGTNG